MTTLVPVRGLTSGRKWGGLIYNYILKTSVPKIEDFEPRSNTGKRSPK